MSVARYREATRPEVLQRWHGRLNEATAVGDVEALEALADEIAEALDHATGWAAASAQIDELREYYLRGAVKWIRAVPDGVMGPHWGVPAQLADKVEEVTDALYGPSRKSGS